MLLNPSILYNSNIAVGYILQPESKWFCAYILFIWVVPDERVV